MAELDSVQALVTEHLDFAAMIARGERKHLPPVVDSGDIEQAAYLGLTKAARKFDREICPHFKPYARRFIYGEIHELNRRKNFKHNITDQLGGGVTDEYNGPDVEKARDERHNEPSDERTESPEIKARGAELLKIAADLIDTLPLRQRIVVRQYYFGGLTMRRIGAMMRPPVNESWISQLHTQAMEQLAQAAKLRGLKAEELLDK